MNAAIRVIEVLECGGPGGTGNQVAALCNGLPKNSFEVHLAYAVRPGINPKDYEATATGAHTHHYIPEMVREISPCKDLFAWWELFHVFIKIKPDIVHAHSSKAGVLARTAALAAGVPHIFYSPRGYAHQQADRSPVSRRLYRLLETAVSWIGKIVAVSESEASLARALTSEDKVITIRDAFLGNTPEKKEAVTSTPTVCASGRLCFPRNPQAFARLAANTREQAPQTQFIWIGDGELRPEVERIQRESGLETRLTITGWLPQKEAFSRTQRADIFVHFSRWEGLPNAVLEAMAAGLPVVASDIPPNRELIRHGETGFLAANEQELAAHVETLIQDSSLRTRMGTAAREIILQNFSSKRMFREYTRLYKDASANS